ncbi:ubiquinone biosynthesis methyltransferase [Fusarium beomiforme]|uniref:Ubiquinone biosynthesis methyltransferase n=1 Tax=Fusarium beomiforme TaxID=44412 RepID=A0A9P5AEE9_9HYPO|nr:ubiquinone biosynthesis methyltransferase [Fusarium beomiforme]
MSSSPAVTIALLVLTLFAVLAALAWWLKSQVRVFVRAIFKHRQEKNKASASTVANAGETLKLTSIREPQWLQGWCAT